MPAELSTKRVLSFYLKTFTLKDKREKVLMMLFDGGTLASFKIEELSDDIIAALSILDDEMFLDILIPLFFVVLSAVSIFLKRRMAQ